jgi:hypothetical protein
MKTLPDLLEPVCDHSGRTSHACRSATFLMVRYWQDGCRRHPLRVAVGDQPAAIGVLALEIPSIM